MTHHFPDKHRATLTIGRSKSPFCPRARFDRLRSPIARWTRRLKRLQKPARRIRYIVHRTPIGGLVQFRRMGKSAELANKLQRRCANFFFGRRWLKIEERADVSAHLVLPQRLDMASMWCREVESPVTRAICGGATGTGVVEMPWTQQSEARLANNHDAAFQKANRSQLRTASCYEENPNASLGRSHSKVAPVSVDPDFRARAATCYLLLPRTANSSRGAISVAVRRGPSAMLSGQNGSPARRNRA